VLKCAYTEAKVNFMEGATAEAPYGVQSVRFGAGETPFYTHDGDMTDYTGQPKGLKQLVWERGLWKTGMTKTGGSNGESFSVKATLESQPDISKQRTVLEEARQARPHGGRHDPEVPLRAERHREGLGQEQVLHALQVQLLLP
jgi:chorismate synthase